MRWPKSASNTAARASRRPVRRPRTRSAPDAIDQHGDRPRSSPSRRSTVAATVERIWSVSGASGWPGRATTHSRTRTRSSRMRTETAEPPTSRRQAGPPRPTRATPGTSKRGQPDELGDDAPPDGQLRAAHEATPVRACIGGSRHRRGAAARAATAPGRPSDSAISAGTRVRAVVAATSQANADHPPLRPAVGDDDRAADAEQRRAADPLVVEDGPDPADRRAASAGRRAGRGGTARTRRATGRR